MNIVRGLRILALFISVFVGAMVFAMQDVRAEETVVNQNVVEATLLSQLRQGYRSICEDCRIEFKDVKIPKFTAEDSPDLKIDFENLKWGGSFLLPVTFLGQTQAYISGQVRLHRQGLISARALNALEIITTADIKTDWLDVTFLKDELANEADLNGVVSRRFIGIRQPLLKSDLRRPQVITRGQMIKVVTGDEQFEVTAQMKAEENGSVGDYIRVKSDLNKVLTVKVIEPGTGRLE